MIISSVDEACIAARNSNQTAMAAYGTAFAELAQDPQRLSDNDLFALDTQLGAIPLLKNGRNYYWQRACHQLGFRQNGFFEAGLPIDRFLVIREGAGFLPEFEAFKPAKTALDSMILEMEGEFQETKFRAPALGGPVESHLRYFDSHPSVAYYLSIVVQIINDFGLDASIPEIEVGDRIYKGDLATRFSEVQVPSLFVASPFVTKDVDPDQAQNTGRVREFTNPRALNQQHLVLIGDSHSYTGISAICSYFFAKVSYFWASRASNYGGLRDDIQTAIDSADLVIEESSERFFIRNFGRLPEGIKDPEIG